MEFSELKEVIRWYPTEFGKISGADIWHKEYIDMYIHIPFCLGKCGFCPFNSMPLSKQNLDEYFNALLHEIRMYGQEPYFKDKIINALWIGGGTPSAVPFSYIESILHEVHELFCIDPNAEITLETNLHDLNEEYIKLVSSSTVNRLSIGVQSFNQKYLKMMGRTYDTDWINTFFSFIKKYNLEISIDLMYRYPGQELSEIDTELEAIKGYAKYIDHITLYSLILFPKLPTYERVLSGRLPKQCSLKKYEQMNYAWSKGLHDIGFEQYTSNHYAKNGKVNKYNIDRWGFPQKECISFGPGAFGQIKNYIYCNEHMIADYYSKLLQNEKPIQEGKFINLMERISRYLVLGTKNLSINLNELFFQTGVNIRDFYKDAINKLLENELITISDCELTVTPKGIAYIIDVNKAFQTPNNLCHTQPQYIILDMFEGKRETFDSLVIEDD